MRLAMGIALSIALVCVAGSAFAQEGGRGRGGFGGGGFGGGFGVSRLALLRIEAVQKELELQPEQIAALTKLQEELRGPRGGDRPRGEGGQGAPRRGRRGEGNDGKAKSDTEARRSVPADWYFVQQEGAQQDRGQQRRGNFSPEDLARFRAEAEERAKVEKEKIAAILLPNQLKRLNEIYIQVAGTSALNDADIAKELEITAEQKEKFAKAREDNGAAMRELFQPGADREEMQTKMAELRKKNDANLLAVLTDAQKKKFEELKGKPFALPEGALRGGPGGGRGPGGNRPNPNN